MLARIQQVLVALWALAVATVVVRAWQAGAPGQAAPWLAVLLAGHAVWLAVTVALMRWHNRHDPAPPARWRDTLAAWWSEVRAAPAVFGWRQPFRAGAVPDHLPADGRGRTGVVLVHGFLCNRGLWLPWLRRLRAAGVPFVAVTLEPVFGSIDDYVATIDEAVRRVAAATGRPPLLVGHSMGGLAIRGWMAACSADDRVHGVITIGTPHGGTWLAEGSHFATNARQMRQGSDWLRSLAAREPASRRGLFLCIWGHGDNIVFPASSACLPGARQLHIPATAHLALLGHPDVWAAVGQALGIDGPQRLP
jgi:triacylglycerol lipase